MIITKKNCNNSNLFLENLPSIDFNLLIIIKKTEYLPGFKYDKPCMIFITEEDDLCHSSEKISTMFPQARVYFAKDLEHYIKLHINTKNFSENIIENLYKHTEPAIHLSAKCSSIANILNKENDNKLFVVISATQNYPDSMILLEAATPEFEEKTHIKEIICYPNVI